MRWLSSGLLAGALLSASVVPAALAQNQNAQQAQPAQPPSTGSASGQGNSNMSNMPVIEPKGHSNMPVIAPTGRSNMPVLPPPNTPDSNKNKDAQPK